MPTNEQINKDAEKQHLIHQNKVVAAIEREYNKIIAQLIPLIQAGASRVVIRRRLEQMLKLFVDNSEKHIISGVKYSWEVSTQKNIKYFEKRLKGYDVPEAIKEKLFKSESNRIDAFISRKQNGLRLSDRVWKTAEKFQENINMALDVGIAEGKSAREISRTIRVDLNQPDRLFRRVRDSRGKLKLSKPAAAYKPDPGVYRSAAKNSERLARTEINQAYRAADGAAYENNPLVLGYEIRLSATAKPKTRCELCRTMEGSYPVWFDWKGWHPNCLCFKIPILMSDEMMAKYQKLVARGEDSKEAVEALQKGVRIEALPDKAINWIKDNNERMLGWKNLPLFFSDNKNYILNKVLDLK